MTRPWPAEDGLLVRLRLVGGRVSASSLDRLFAVSEEYGDGLVQLTSRANLQVRALPAHEGRLPSHVRAAVESTGLLPSIEHDLVRNVMVSPQTGLAGGRADLRPLAAALDAALVADSRLADLPGRFLFVLDDGRGDLVDRTCDLGLVALDDTTAQVRVGDGWGPVVPLGQVVDELVRLARLFLEARGEPPHAAWHVHELARPLVPATRPGSRLPVARGSLGYGSVPGGTHVAVPGGLLDRQLAATLTAPVLVVTPWRGVLVPEEAR